MAYCTNCGTDNKNNSKFCPNCGMEITVDSDKNKRRPPPKRKMQKGVVKSLEDSVKNTIGNKAKAFVGDEAKNIIEEGFSKSNNNASKSQIDIENEGRNLEKTGRSTKGQKWMLFYIVVNVLLVLFNSGSNEITGILIFSAIVGAIYFFRKKKEKPFNIIAKIVLVLQAILAFSYLMQLIEFIGSDVFYLIVIVCLVLLIIINVKLIISGNKKS
ncbi:zinc ribbon domain-containing protein [Lutibacter citreus]|uniref:zinc ribbon domain-containing protein n=1 Tax=Lutibacter citreus TaxID=2138210 RepID=UPI000DBE186E|nr:zinc ribbon domain-containing protein [Lutibacter citreus]